MQSSKPLRAARPRQISECVAVYLREGDLEGIVQMFHPDCRIFFPPGEAPKVGLAGAREAFRDLVSSQPTLISEVHHEIVVGDVALLHASWRLELSDGEILAEGNSYEVAKRFSDNSWGYLIDCPNGLPTA